MFAASTAPPARLSCRWRPSPARRLTVTGAATASVQRPDGQVRAGTAIPLDGPASAVITHRAGPIAVWLDGPGISPWPQATPRDVTLPQRLPLTGEAMALAPVPRRAGAAAPCHHRAGDPGAGRRSPGAVRQGCGAGPLPPGRGNHAASAVPAGRPTVRHAGASRQPGHPRPARAWARQSPLPPGSAAVFGFTVTAAGPVGVGVRADPDRVAVRLLDDHGATLERGVSMLRQLQPGRYVLEARVPPDAPTTMAAPRGARHHAAPQPPPPDIVRGLLIAAGFAPPDSAR